MSKITKYLHVEGTVQGVGYRATLHALAKKYHIGGWVRNLPDGSVETTIQGDEETIKKLFKWCQTGPTGANVTNVTSKDLVEYVEDYQDFKIIY